MCRPPKIRMNGNSVEILSLCVITRLYNEMNTKKITNYKEERQWHQMILILQGRVKKIEWKCEDMLRLWLLEERHSKYQVNYLHYYFLQEKNPNFYKQTGISLEKTKNLAYIRKVVKNEMYVTWVGRKLMAWFYFSGCINSGRITEADELTTKGKVIISPYFRIPFI